MDFSYAIDPAKAATERLRAARRRQQGGLGVYRAPTIADTLYDAVGTGYAGLHRLTGAPERDAATSGSRARRALSDTVETVFMPAAAERSGRQILRGEGTLGDVGTVALASLPVTGKYVVKGARAAAPLIKAATPEVIQKGVGAVGDWLGHMPEMVRPDWYGHGGTEVSMPGAAASPTLRVVGAPEGRSLTVPGVRRVPVDEAGVATGPAVAAGTREVADYSPPPPALIPSGEGLTDLPSRPREWWPDKGLVANRVDPRDVGWGVRDRGDGAHPNTRWQSFDADGNYRTTVHPTEEEAWARAERTVNKRPVNNSPEAQARKAGAEAYAHHGMETEQSDWLEKALTKYYKRDFGTETDPLLDLARRELHYDPDMTPAKWSEIANNSIGEDPLGYFTVPKFGQEKGPRETLERNSPLAVPLEAAAPWLAGRPVTDPLHMMKGAPELDPFTSKLTEALRPDTDLPKHLRVNPSQLSRLTFPQAVERVGKINAWRAEENAKALAATPNPAIRLHKEYPDDPRGLRWVELQAPPEPKFAFEEKTGPGGDTYWEGTHPETGEVDQFWGPRESALREAQATFGDKDLLDALGFEGDNMGHCTKRYGKTYCNEILRGEGKIFSLRDKQGMPHVTIETTAHPQTPDGFGHALNTLQPGVWGDITAHPDFYPLGPQETVRQHFPELWEKFNKPSIRQIKGKANEAPVDRYLPHVQDFVKSGNWGHVADLGHTGLTRLPDGRFLTTDQVKEAFTKAYPGTEMWPNRQRAMNWLSSGAAHQTDGVWDQYMPIFEGYAYGGRVERDRDFAYGPLAVHMADGGRVDRDVIAEASERYPFIRDLDPALVEGDHLETWAPGETGTEGDWRPDEADLDRLAVQGPRGMSVEDFVGETLHADPRAIATRDALWSTLTPEQTERLKREAGDYAVTLERGGTEDRAMQNAVDSLIRGYTVKQWPQEALDRFGLDEVQQGDLDALQGYMEGR